MRSGNAHGRRHICIQLAAQMCVPAQHTRGCPFGLHWPNSPPQQYSPPSFGWPIKKTPVVSLNPPALLLGAVVTIKPEAASAAASVSLDPVARLITCPPPRTAVAAVSAAAWDGVGPCFREGGEHSGAPRHGVMLWGCRGVFSTPKDKEHAYRLGHGYHCCAAVASENRAPRMTQDEHSLPSDVEPSVTQNFKSRIGTAVRPANLCLALPGMASSPFQHIIKGGTAKAKYATPKARSLQRRTGQLVVLTWC